MLIVKATCTNCGAPLSLADGQRHVICAYCDLSMLVERPGGTAPAQAQPTLLTERISPDDIRRVKQLILEGKRPEAVTFRSGAISPVSSDADQRRRLLDRPALDLRYDEPQRKRVFPVTPIQVLHS